MEHKPHKPDFQKIEALAASLLVDESWLLAWIEDNTDRIVEVVIADRDLVELVEADAYNAAFRALAH